MLLRETTLAHHVAPIVTLAETQLPHLLLSAVSLNLLFCWGPFTLSENEDFPRFFFVAFAKAFGLYEYALTFTTHFKTLDHTRILSTADWCISGCKPGYAGTTTCTQCPVNTYSPGHLEECMSCGELSETDGPGATSAEDCSKFFFQFLRNIMFLLDHSGTHVVDFCLGLKGRVTMANVPLLSTYFFKAWWESHMCYSVRQTSTLTDWTITDLGRLSAISKMTITKYYG